jgi:prophage DNA circulation protein
MQLLNDFLVKVSQVSYLFNCEEVQTFLRGSADFCKTSEDFKEKTTVEIAENYSELFQESIFFQSLPEEDAKVQKWFEVFSVFLNNLENFSQSCKTVFENFSCFENSVNEMISGINEITSFYSQTYEFSSSEIPRRPAYSNPYSLPLDWSRVVILDIKAVIELISSRSKLIKSKTKTKEKLEIEGKKLEEKKTGKKKISQIFSKTTKEQRVAKQEKKIQELEIELKSYEKICKIVTEKFLNVEVSQLRKSLNESFRHIIEKFAESISGEIDEIFIQFMPLKTMFDEQILKDS